jgi:hypothetical protein
VFALEWTLLTKLGKPGTGVRLCLMHLPGLLSRAILVRSRKQVEKEMHPRVGYRRGHERQHAPSLAQMSLSQARTHSTPDRLERVAE